MWEHAEFIHHVVTPEDIGIFRGNFDRRLAWPGHILAFVHEWPLIAIALAIQVEADHFTPAGDDIDPVALDRGGAENAEILPVIDLAARKFGHGQLP